MDEQYRSSYTGPQVDGLLSRMNSAIQPSDLLSYLLKEEAARDYVQKEDGKGLSSHDFSSELKVKLEALPTYQQLLELLDTYNNYRILGFSTTTAATRLQVPASSRRYGMIVSYNNNGDHVTEKYISSLFTDSEWVKDDNWVPLVVYEKPKVPDVYGVYVLDTTGYYTAWRQWDISNNNKAVGVAVIDSVKFIIAPNDVAESMWANVDTPVTGVMSAWNDSEIVKDYFGYENTIKIIEQLGERAPAANLCWNYIFKNSEHGYLPGFGNWMKAFKYQTEVDNALQAIGGTQIPWYTNYWSSTQVPSRQAWNFRWCHSEHAATAKNTTLHVRPFGRIL